MRVLICGDRKWTDRGMIDSCLMGLQYDIAINGGGPLLVIEGEASGADRIAREQAEYHGIECQRFPAEWTVHAEGWCKCKRPLPKLAACPSAGPRRNQQMLTEGKPDVVLAFHDDIENSKGTKDMVERARKADVPVRVLNHRDSA